MAAELQFDVAEKIFIGFDVKELMRFKCVCKSWQSFLSNPCFVHAHVKHNVRKNNKLGRRIITSSTACMVGSSNGLVCISPGGAKLVITNPLTRVLRKLPKLSCYFPRSARCRDSLCWGFGYDSSIDDYKVIVGFMKDNGPTRFLVLTLKTFTWKYIGLVDYRNIGRQSAILCNGALHWFMKTTNREKNENVILSFDISLNEFKEIPLPDDHDNNKSNRDHKSLGIINECLCICDDQQPYHMWVMKNYNVKESWDRTDLYQYGDYCATKSDIVHHVELVAGGIISYKIIRSSLSAYCVSDPIFVQSLASPHLYNNGRPKKALKDSKNNKRGVFRVG